MLQIRLHRTGKTNRPYFRVVVAEHRRAAQGPYVSALGFWDPLKDRLTIDHDRLKEWEKRGAWATDRISRLFKKNKIHYKFVAVHERPDRGPKNLKIEAAEKVKVETGARVETKTAEAGAHPEQVAESAEPEKPSEPTPEVPKEEVKAEPVESAESEVNTVKEEGEERAKSPTGDPP